MNIVDWAVSTMDSLGALGVALLIFLENLFPPIPSEVILPLAGVAAAGPNQSYMGMLLASVIGSVTGAWVLYGLGRMLGPERLRALFIRLPLLNVHDYDKTVDWMDRHGYKGVFFGRMVPGVRSLISIPAGLYAMPMGMFTVLTAVGSTIWNTIFVTIGYFLGSNWTVIAPYTDVLSYVVYAIIAGLLLWTLYKLLARERERRRLGLPDPDDQHLARVEQDRADGAQVPDRAGEPTADGKSAGNAGSADRGPGERGFVDRGSVERGSADGRDSAANRETRTEHDR